MVYRGLSWSMVLFGLIGFFGSYEIIRDLGTARELIACMFLGSTGAVMFGFGVVGLWEIWQKKG